MNHHSAPVIAQRRDGATDTDVLERLFQALNQRFFDNQIQARLCWEIPQGTVGISSGTPGTQPKPGSALARDVDKVIALAQQEKWQQLMPLLQRCADAGHADSELLLSHLLKKQGDERWLHYAAAHNRHLETLRAVPAACYYAESRIIALHPHLAERNAPQFVLKYLIYHECCHQLICSSEGDPHPAAFMAWEYRAPHRNRALAWLTKEGFPTLPAAPPKST